MRIQYVIFYKKTYVCENITYLLIKEQVYVIFYRDILKWKNVLFYSSSLLRYGFFKDISYLIIQMYVYCISPGLPTWPGIGIELFNRLVTKIQKLTYTVR